MEEENRLGTGNGLAGKVALVTGAGRGIGRAIALVLAGQGARVLVNYNGSRERALEVVEQIETAGGQAEAIGCDVSDFDACGRTCGHSGEQRRHHTGQSDHAAV